MAIGGRTEATSARPRPFWAHLYVQVLIAIVAGALLGHFAPATGEALKPLGDGFIRLVKMVIAPVIFLTLVSGIAGLGELRGVGRVAARAFGYTFGCLFSNIGGGKNVTNEVMQSIQQTTNGHVFEFETAERLAQ